MLGLITELHLRVMDAGFLNDAVMYLSILWSSFFFIKKEGQTIGFESRGFQYIFILFDGVCCRDIHYLTTQISNSHQARSVFGINSKRVSDHCQSVVP